MGSTESAKLHAHLCVVMLTMLAAILTLGTSAFAQNTPSQYVSFDAPHAGTGSGQGTFPTAINRHGWIAGTLIDNAGLSRGFLRRRNGTFIAVNAPGASQTFVAAINANDEAAGSYYLGTATYGFLRDAAGTYTQIAYPSAYATIPAGINGSGVVVGFAFLTGTPGDVAFLWDSQHGFTTFSVPWAKTNTTLPLAINGAGTVAGYYYDKNSYSHGFVRNQNGGVTPFIAISGGTQTQSVAINSSGQVAGWGNDGLGGTDAFLRDTNGTINLIGLPGSPGSAATAVNDSGVVVGYYFSDAGGNGSFEWDPSGTITNIGTQLPFANTANQAVGINVKGNITGVYTDLSGVNHGWERVP